VSGQEAESRSRRVARAVLEGGLPSAVGRSRDHCLCVQWLRVGRERFGDAHLGGARKGVCYVGVYSVIGTTQLGVEHKGKEKKKTCPIPTFVS